MSDNNARINLVTAGNDVHFQIIVDNVVIRTYKLAEGQRAKDFCDGYNTSQRNK